MKLLFTVVVTNEKEVNVDETVNNMTRSGLLLEPTKANLGCIRCSCSSIRDDASSIEDSKS